MKNTLIVALFMFISLCLTTCKTESDIDLYGTIEGIVTDAVTNEPIQGALVTISPISTSKNTGSDGRYTFSSLEPQLFNIQVTHNGYETENKSITVEPGETRNGDIKLSPIIPILHVNVIGLDFGPNLTSLPVQITNTGKGELEWVVTETASWITANPLQGAVTSETDNIIVSVDRTGLTAGSFEQSINITSNGGNASILVTLSVQ